MQPRQAGLTSLLRACLVARLVACLVACWAHPCFATPLALPSVRPPVLPSVPPPPLPSNAAIDAEVGRAMVRTRAMGLAVAVIEAGRVRYVQAYGQRNAHGDALLADSVMAGASLTKTVVAYTALTLVDQGLLGLDTPLAEALDKPLPDYDPEAIFRGKYAPYPQLAGDSRWRRITPRMCLNHSTGFANFHFFEPDKRLRIHADPGARYSYSGEGFILLQFVIENGRSDQGLGLELGALTDAVFTRLQMTRTALKRRADFTPHLADGWNDQGEARPHGSRSKVRAAGSMDTTITDIAQFAAALVRGEGLSEASFAEMLRPQLKIDTAHQFPVLAPPLPPARQRPDLYAGLGVVLFNGPQGPGFYKGGHDEQTANTLVCLKGSQRCAVILANDVRAEAAFPALVAFLLGETGVPFAWEYGDRAGKS